MNKKDHVADKLFYHEHLSCMVLEVRGDTLAAKAESNTKFPLSAADLGFALSARPSTRSHGYWQ